MDEEARTAVEHAVSVLAAVPVGALTIAQLQALVGASTAAAARLAGIGSRALGELTERGGGVVPAGSAGTCATAAWLRDVAQVSGRRAGQQVRTALALRELPQVADAVVEGRVTLEHARVLTRLVGRIDPLALRKCQPDLLEVARRCDPDALALYVRHLLATWCEPQLDADEEAAHGRRYFQVVNQHNGSWRGRFELPDAMMEAVLTALEPLSRREGDDDARTSGQRRADALVDVFTLAIRHGSLPDSGGQQTRLTYVVPADWLAPRSAADFHVDGDRPPGWSCATGAWTGPQTRSTLATVACSAGVDRLNLTSNGRIVSLISQTDQISAAQRRAVTARDRHCTAKGCSRPPGFCDLHHLQARADGGPHHTANLVLLCRRHHSMWHRSELDLSDLRVPWLRLPSPPLRT